MRSVVWAGTGLCATIRRRDAEAFSAGGSSQMTALTAIIGPAAIIPAAISPSRAWRWRNSSRRCRSRGAIRRRTGRRSCPVVSVRVRPAPCKRRAKLLWPHEALPLMGADGQPAQDVFGADNGERVGLERAVERGQDHEPFGLHQRRDRLRGRPARRARARSLRAAARRHSSRRDADERLGGGAFIVDCEAARLRHALSPLRCSPRPGRCRSRWAPSRASGSQTRPPPQPISSTLRPGRLVACFGSRPKWPAEPVADIGEPHRIDAVERLERAGSVPPLPAEPRKAGDLVAGRAWLSSAGLAPCGHRPCALNLLSRRPCPRPSQVAVSAQSV